MDWHIRSSALPSTKQDVLRVLFENRDLLSEEQQQAFLHPKPPSEWSVAEVGIDPEQMRTALGLLQQAKQNHWEIMVFGDYDADGICATTALWQVLHATGHQVTPFIPEREKHGYGLSTAALQEILSLEKKPKLFITVDNGVVAHDAFAQLREAGILTILTDHHQIDPSGYPAVDAVIHTTALCGTTVAWMLAREVDAAKAESGLDVCGIATIADQVPLTGANRSFAYHGLQALRTTTRPGLLGLMGVAEIAQETITTQEVHYGLAPRINAMGRVATPLDALRLLCTNSVAKVTELSAKLQATNSNRQDLTLSMIQSAIALAASQQQEKCIVVADESFHEGIIGLIAGKLTEKYYKPAVVIKLNGQVSKGSARSVPGVNITDLLRSVRTDLLDVGGHPMAAGCSLRTDQVADFTRHLQEQAQQTIEAETLVPSLHVECILPTHVIDVELCDAIESLAPFGSGNPPPLFGMQGCEIHKTQLLGKEGQHVKFLVRTKHGGRAAPFIQVLAFNMAEQHSTLQPGDVIQVAGSLRTNTWNGQTNVQVIAKDVIVEESQG